MGYFANGSEGMSYEERYCLRCLHGPQRTDKGCAVWDAHQLYNYEDCNKKDSILHILIPRTKDDDNNEQCAMFLEDPHSNKKKLPL